MTDEFFPGIRVRLADRPEWGEGQVQSVAGDRITVNFEHAGKVMILRSQSSLVAVDEAR